MLTTTLLAATTTTGWGQETLPLYEGFNYTVGQALQTQTGWTAVNSGDDILIAADNLTYSGLESSTGNKVTFNGSGIDASKAFTTQSAGTVFYSFIMNVSDLGSLNATGGYFTGFAQNSTTFGATVWTGLDGAGYKIGINPRTSTTTNMVWVTGTQSLNNSVLVVVSYEFGAGSGDDIVNIWVNPSPSTLGQASAPTPSATATNTGGTDLTGISQIFIRQDSDTETPFIGMDELRVGTSWADVTPAATADVTPPVATFAPGNGATGVATAAAPTITFDEAIHNISDGSLVTDPTSLITFTKNDAMGEAVPFTATIDAASKVITVTPDAPGLTVNQLYYLSVDKVQDADGNQQLDAQSITFTTAAALSDATEITSFTLAGVAGTIDATNHAIGVVLPYGTDVTAIEPTIELSLGATVDLSGVQDFTNPVTYTVTAEDGVATIPWLVTVTFSAPEFTATYPKSANVGKNQFNVVVNLKSAAKVYYMMQASGTPEPASADIKTANNVIDVTTPATDYPVTFNGLDASTTYDVYFVTEDNGGTILMATPVKLSVTTSAGVLTIYDIQYTTDPSGDSPYKDQVVTFSGIVTAIKLSATTGAPIGFYIQDGAGKWNGMNVYSTATDYSFPTTLALGDNVTVNGTVTEYRGSAGTNLTGLTEVKEVTSVDIVSTGNALPAASIITAAEAQDEGYESVLITVKNANFVSDNAGGTCVVNDGTADLTLYKSLFPTLAISAAHKYDVTGIITDYSNASTSMYELYPRDANDVVDVTTGINDNKTVATKVYPNPFTSNFTVNSGKVVSTISVYNLLGQKIVEHNYSAAEVNVPVADLKSGVYIVNVRFQDGTTTNLRMVKK